MLLTIVLAFVAFASGTAAAIYIIRLIAEYMANRAQELKGIIATQTDIINDQQQRLNKVELHVSELRAEIRSLREATINAEARREKAIIKLIDCKSKQQSAECRDCLEEVHDILSAVNY